VRSRDVARRIAEDLYAMAAEEKTADAVEIELRQIAASTEEAPPPAGPTPAGDRREVIRAAFPEASGGLRHLMGLLIRDLVLGEFLSVRAEAEGVLRARVVTAQPLSSEERSRLTERLGRSLGMRVKLEESVDPAVLAGVRIEIEGRILDGTLRARLTRLRETLGRSGEA
jgi:F-type H+-transporting ATPase subunit delta